MAGNLRDSSDSSRLWKTEKVGAPAIFFSPTSGLGNSMLALISTTQLAKKLNAPFAVDWSRDTSPSCQASFQDLFMKFHTDAGELNSCSRSCELDLTQRGKMSCWRVIACGSKQQIEQIFHNCNCVRVRSNQFYLPALQPQTRKLESNFRLIAETHLNPSVSISHRIALSKESWEKEFGVTHIMGVHVRAAHANDGVINGNWIPKKKTFERIFWPCLQRAIAELHGQAEVIGVFVAADTPEVRTEASLLLSLDDRVVELPTPLKTIPNDTGLGPLRTSDVVQDAALELFLLKESDSLFVKHGIKFDSTFSASAMALAQCDSSTSCYFVEQNKCEVVTAPVIPDFHLQEKISCDNFMPEDVDSCELRSKNPPSTGAVDW